MWRYASETILVLAALSALPLLSSCASGHENEPETHGGEWTVLEYMPGPGQFINERTDLRSIADES